MKWNEEDLKKLVKDAIDTPPTAEELVRFARGELPPAETAIIRAHLERYPETAEMLDIMREHVGILAQEDDCVIRFTFPTNSAQSSPENDALELTGKDEGMKLAAKSGKAGVHSFELEFEAQGIQYTYLLHVEEKPGWIYISITTEDESVVGRDVNLQHPDLPDGGIARFTFTRLAEGGAVANYDAALPHLSARRIAIMAEDLSVSPT